nr:hypothetical protein [Variovorax paradoxus]
MISSAFVSSFFSSAVSSGCPHRCSCFPDAGGGENQKQEQLRRISVERLQVKAKRWHLAVGKRWVVLHLFDIRRRCQQLVKKSFPARRIVPCPTPRHGRPSEDCFDSPAQAAGCFCFALPEPTTPPAESRIQRPMASIQG